MPRLFSIAFCAVFFSSFSLQKSIASAGSRTEIAPEVWATSQVLVLARRTPAIADIKTKIRELYWRADLDGKGVSPAGIQLKQAIEKAKFRAHVLPTWLQRDLNNDGMVTRKELTELFNTKARTPVRTQGITIRPTEEQVAAVREKLVLQALESDLNGDDTISFAEARESAQTKAVNSRRWPSRSVVPLSLDTNGDGIVSLVEVETLTATVLQEVDADKNGQISKGEISHFRAAQQMRKKRLRDSARKAKRAAKERQSQATKQANEISGCRLPKPVVGARVIMVGTYKGGGLSTIVLGDETEETSVATVNIEAGEQPLYIVLSSYGATIWRFSGAVSRVVQVVASSNTAGKREPTRTGVVGVDPKYVTTTNKSTCLRYFTEANATHSLESRAKLRKLIGREADDVFAARQMGTISLPSGKKDQATLFKNFRALPDTGPSAGLWQSTLLSWPNGVIEIDPTDVVTPATRIRPDVLRKAAGLASLVDNGVLEGIGTVSVLTNGRTTIVDNGAGGISSSTYGYREVEGFRHISYPREFRILKQTKLPAGYCHHSVPRFTLPKNISAPTPGKCLPCIVSEETGSPIEGSGKCR